MSCQTPRRAPRQAIARLSTRTGKRSTRLTGASSGNGSRRAPDIMRFMPAARLILEDATVYEGESFGSAANSIGEVVFNTSLTGYQEIATDPSYRFQIVVMTYPHIGNYGVEEAVEQSAAPQVSGV